MPKSLKILPDEMRRAGQIEFTPIPLNQYRRTLKEELDRFAREDLVRIYRDMLIIRTFESMLDSVKKTGGYRGIAYNHRGPAHLSIGQEAAAVGQAFLLDVNDHIFGSHRSHGEILAKGLSAIEKLPEETLQQIMERYWDGATLRVVEKRIEQAPEGPPLHKESEVRNLAIDYLLYGALAEIFGRETGFNKGMGGSMHAFFPPFGIYPNNAIVGGSADISVGAALYKRVQRKPGIVICNIGDAAITCGPTWEAMCFANMDQFKTLFEEPYRGGLPIIFNFVNNFYGMGGQLVGETGGFGILARVGAGLNASQMHAERIDGYNPLAVIDAIARKKEILAKGEGPVLLDTVTYRYSGHSPSDASSYREKSEVEEWQRIDSLITYRRELLEAGLITESELETMQQAVETAILRAYLKAIDLDISPRANLFQPGCLLEQTMFSNQHVESLDNTRKPVTLLPHQENPRVQRLASRSRSGIGPDGTPLPKSRCIGIRDALFEAILDCFETDPTLIAYGEENRDWGGAFGVYQGLTESLPYHRLFNAPIAEGAIVGTAVGYALEGGRALVEIMYCDFIGRAGDEIFNQLAKWQAMSGGLLRMPVVVRVSVGSKYGAQHSQDWTSLCAHIPGLKVVFPATPYDAKGLMYAALTGTDPVIFFESQRIYDQPELFHGAEGVPEGRYMVPIGQPDVKRTGEDITILSVGATLYRALEAADILEKEYNLKAEIIDARSLVPFDYAPVLESVKKTGRILLTSDACERGSILQTFAAKIAHFAFDDLDAPPIVVGARNWITPPDEIEESFFPYPSDILDAIHTHILPLPGYTPKRVCDKSDLLWRSREGV
ncbi:pyruvate/2-oxoglutarate dehydrogenase complex, dehydrogenase component beta subunit [Chthonomonas calidirosea]|uniref:Pyruvate/2-oxoglutarate dehydrogenase complex,dehydrogenase (E1) component, eukaryotic type, beta subunit n=1 Tax=Chthonomonas calidirosea (strain DSM 23976 / ICMP 18418 / T49) TaxID=1303518 RepID=S0EU03_CHTCT|nr:alpha-ketoacid dehydrogenase subunit alpha/beta [Chthonomonas calidirosea]CCW35105.1 Pyruvate/2-oxoglutarate dehydrogenase complex,dehydrogenase (E1) component, eukaryotic type, beta subunit [Chthonomonas calidirosea T49]CEK20878.1 pyruvate/2-oxoglutarate dehydrogenase complex, dehydrogenase component beta subunit [Chthonomonas calidirosea]